MASTQIRGTTQIQPGSIADAQIQAAAAIQTSKLADGAKFIKSDGTVAMAANLSLGNFLINNVGNPSTSTDAANKSYVDLVAQGTGDMLKSVYDTNANNVVDTCDSLAWSKITGAPAYMNWVPYTGPPQSFANRDLTRDGDWTMVANKATSDRPAPQQSGSEEDLLPAWTPVTQSLRASYTVYNEWTINSGGWIDQYGMDVLSQNAGAVHTLTLYVNGAVKDTFTSTPNIAQIYIHNITPLVVSSGAVIRVKLQVEQISNNLMYWVQQAGLFATPPIYCSLAQGSKDGATAGTTAYGCHLLFIPATFSPDWDVIAYGGMAAGAGGGGDMFKSTYDSNNDGISDHAALSDTAPWTGITGKPSTFAPSAHAPSHLDNGADPIPVATTSRTGSLCILNGTATTFLDGTGNWSTPAPAGTVNPGTWTALSYSTGWTLGTSAQYRIETNGSFQKVICQGIINYASGAASLAFTLPNGARPAVQRGCSLAGQDSSGDVQLFQAVVATSGAVNIYPLVRQNFSWPSATNGSVYLEGLVFSL